MINSLSMEDMVHSRLRGCIAEKGSRGSEAVDKIFDKILGEVGKSKLHFPLSAKI